MTIASLRMVIVVVFLLAASAGWAVGLWTSRPIETKMNPFLRILCWVIYLLWCLSWLPTIVGMLAETPGQPDTPERNVIRLVCAANAMLFYVGGGIWLVVQCRGHRGKLIALAWIIFCFGNNLGPATLLLVKTLLGTELKEQPGQASWTKDGAE
jgi:hypothetical protein